MIDDSNDSNESRALTPEEMRKIFLDKIRSTLWYWKTTDISRPEFQTELRTKGEIQYRMEGLVHSILVMLDGGTELPAFDITPSPHPGDEQFYRDEGSNWWPNNTIMNECQLHELWHKMDANQKNL